jgi:fumarate reductase flavoprotein subunit
MELGPRDKVSQAFWHEWRKGNTIPTPRGDVVYLDLRHLGEKKLLERDGGTFAHGEQALDAGFALLVGLDTPHGVVGGRAHRNRLAGEQAMQRAMVAGEANNAALDAQVNDIENRLKVVDLRIQRRVVGFARDHCALHSLLTGKAAKDHQLGERVGSQTVGAENRLKDLVNQQGNENWAKIRDEMGMSMEEGCGI